MEKALVVNEPAGISRLLTEERILKVDHPTSGLECEGKGFPAPSFQWFKDGEPVDTKRYKIETVIVKSICSSGDYCSQTVTSTLLFTKPLKWAEKENYSCRAANGADQKGVDDVSWTVIRVNHGPVVLNQRFPEEGLAAADIGTMVGAHHVVVCTCPITLCDLRSSGAESSELGVQLKPDRGEWKHYNRDEYENILQIPDTNESDYGSYMSRVANGMGKAEVIIKLTRTGSDESSEAVSYTEVFAAWLGALIRRWLRAVIRHRIQVFSEFLPLVIATTNDVNEDPNMLAPALLSFDLIRKSIVVEVSSMQLFIYSGI
ncbi:unnamed protein product [Heligmosomoides polygyrus]|uniref:Ig-like domain-containing protein n=1 Tax=Heligmosomoides polygyrus TaxID=6339 RepID=A0A183F5C2_HELPZ|nr:unnamed protein product [Heligmosomoides polygyrus]